MGRLIFYHPMHILWNRRFLRLQKSQTYFVFHEIFNIMILYWNIFYLYIFTVKLLFIYLRRIK